MSSLPKFFASKLYLKEHEKEVAKTEKAKKLLDFIKSEEVKIIENNLQKINIQKEANFVKEKEKIVASHVQRTNDQNIQNQIGSQNGENENEESGKIEKNGKHGKTK